MVAAGSVVLKGTSLGIVSDQYRLPSKQDLLLGSEHLNPRPPQQIPFENYQMVPHGLA